MPTFGVNVVNGYGATFGWALVTLRDQRRLARVRKPDQAHVGQRLQFQFDFELLARLAVLEFAGRLVRRTLERRVAASAASALCQHEWLGVLHQIGDQFACRFRVGGRHHE
jgi:hypothetical protein